MIILGLSLIVQRGIHNEERSSVNIGKILNSQHSIELSVKAGLRTAQVNFFNFIFITPE